MKKLYAFLLVLAMLLALTACGGGNQALVGTWEITDGDGSTYGWGMRFTNEGKFYFATGTDPKSQSEVDEAFESLDALYTITYKVKSATEMELTTKVLGGFGGSETVTVNYQINGDTMVFDGSTYKRVK